MKLTDAEIDSIALAIYNASREWNGQLPAESLGAVHQPTPWRMAARAALDAREELLEVAEERWVIRGPRGFWSLETREEALALAEEKRAAGVTVRLKHVVTKRRKR